MFLCLFACISSAHEKVPVTRKETLKSKKTYNFQIFVVRRSRPRLDLQLEKFSDVYRQIDQDEGHEYFASDYDFNMRF